MNNFFLKNENVVLIWEVPLSSPVPTIEIKDLNGNTISSGSGILIPGTFYLYYFDAGTLSVGNYFYVITWGSDITVGSFSVKDISQEAGGGGYILNITVKDNNPVPNTIPFAIVYIYNDTNIFITGKMTDSNGFVQFVLPQGNYKIMGFKPGYSFNFYSLFLNANMNLDYTGIPLIYSPAPDPAMCRIHVNLIDFMINPAENVQVIVDIVKLPQVSSDKLLTWNSKIFLTDATGYVYFDVIRNSTIRVKILPARVDHEIVVPDTPSAILADIIRSLI